MIVMNKVIKVFTALCCVLAIALSLPTPAMAAAYQHVTRTTSYAHPDTGEIIDGGSKANEALGNSMCDGIVDNTVLIEKSGGTTYVTLGIGLMSNIESVSFYVAKEGQTDPSQFQRVQASKVGSCTRDGDTCYHYRFALPSGTKYISPKIYVTPMGREVQFFVKLNMGSIADGRGDFDHGQKAPVKPAKKPAKKPSKQTVSESKPAVKKPSKKSTSNTKKEVEQTKPNKKDHQQNQPVKETSKQTNTQVKDQAMDNKKEEKEAKKTSYAFIVSMVVGVAVIAVGTGIYLKRRKG